MMMQSSPNNFGEGPSLEMEQPPQLEPQVLTTDESPQGGGQLIIDPKGTTKDVAPIPSENLIDVGNPDQEAVSLSERPDLVNNPEAREQEHNNLVQQLSEDLPDLLKAGSMDEVWDVLAAELKERNANSSSDSEEPLSEEAQAELEEAKTRFEKWKERAGVVLGPTGEWVVDGWKDSDFQTFLDNFFSQASGSGRFGGGFSGVEGGEGFPGTDGDQKLLKEIEGDPVMLAIAIEKAFSDKGYHVGVGDLRRSVMNKETATMEQAINFFIDQMQYPDRWVLMQQGLSDFVDPTGNNKYVFSEKTQAFFESLKYDSKKLEGLINPQTESKQEPSQDDQ